jgi:Na+/proline symporter
LVLVILGLALKKRATSSLEDYFIGGRKLPWWALGISGMASFLDASGTMIIVAFLYMLGPRGLFIEFRGGAVLPLVFAIIWMGKWHRRSRCVTGAEWMVYRFGKGFGGKFAQIMSVVATIAFTIGMLAMLIKGAGLFLSLFVPFTPTSCAIVMVFIATAYTLLSGFYGVVFTDIFQAGIILVGVLLVVVLAVMKIAGTEAHTLEHIAYAVTGNSQWTSTGPVWQTHMPAGFEQYRFLMIFALFYFSKSFIDGMGMHDDPKYFGARNDRECGLLSFLWVFLMMFRWPLMIGFAILGLYLVYDIFPDQTLLMQVRDLILSHVGTIDKAGWDDVIANVANRPSDYPNELISSLSNLLGQDWTAKINLLSFEGTVNPEKILPSVLLFCIPIGFRGLLLVVFIAAFMSTFDSQLNKATGFFIRDIYQCYIRPKANNQELIRSSYLVGLFMVVVGWLLATQTDSINQIWGWVAIGLLAGLGIPRFLRFYWWRFNGQAFGIGTLAGLIAAISTRVLFPNLDERLQFLLMASMSLAASVLGTFLTKPVEREVLENFYKTTLPFGFWKPFERNVSQDSLAEIKKEHRNDFLSVPFVMGWQITLFMLPMQLMVGAFREFWITLIIFAICFIGLYQFWYRNLPKESEKKVFESEVSEIAL